MQTAIGTFKLALDAGLKRLERLAGMHAFIVRDFLIACIMTLIAIGSGYLYIMLSKGIFQAVAGDWQAAELKVNEERVLLNGPQGSFSFAVLGDMRWESPPQIAILRDAQQRKPLFMVNVGDVVNSSRKVEWEKYLGELAVNWDRDIPYFHIPGRHSLDFRITGTYPASFQNLFGRTYYCVDVNEWRFIFLDTSKGSIPEQQFEWVAKRLDKAAKGQRKI